MLLDEDADESLHAAHDGSVQHHGAVACAVFAHVFGVQPLGHGKVHLDGAALPLAANGIFERVFDLGAVERAIARRHDEVAASGAQAFHQRVFGLVPDGVGADALLGPRGYLVDDVGKAEVGIHLLQQGAEGADFGLYLVFGAEDVTVVLREGAHAHDAVQAARWLVAVAGAEFTVA